MVWVKLLQIKPTKKRQKHKNTGIDTECEGVVKAAPEQQGWQSAAGGRRVGGWCTYNSNSNDCQEEENPERDARWEDRGRRRRRQTAQGSQTVARIRLENKIRNPQRLEQRETGGWFVTENTAQEGETCKGTSLQKRLLHNFVISLFTF